MKFLVGNFAPDIVTQLRNYAKLMRLDRPIGIFLLLWPALWALLIAGEGRPDALVLVVFILGVILMRSAGCVINDFADRDIDGHVQRTRERPLAAGRVSELEAKLLFLLLWEGVVWAAGWPNYKMASPSDLWPAFTKHWSLFVTMGWQTLWRTVLGLLLAVVVGVLIGALTAFSMGLVGIVQNDIKRVIAYSTLSQLGYMTVALGVSAYSAAIFHLMTHAFFKALLFLGAGSVIIALHHQQDMRFMGGLKKYMPVTHITFLVSCLAIAGCLIGTFIGMLPGLGPMSIIAIMIPVAITLGGEDVLDRVLDLLDGDLEALRRALGGGASR